MRLNRPVLALVSLLLAPALLFAQSAPADELLRLVPDDAGFCFIVNDLRGHSQKLQNSAWVQALVHSPIGRAVRATPEFGKLLRANQDLKEHLQFDWPLLRDEILGHAVVFAYRPASPSEAEQGLLLLRTPNAGLLAELIDRFQKLQKDTGELRELGAVDYKGAQYMRRVDNKGTNFYYLKDGLLAFSSREALIRTVIDRVQSAASARFAEPIRRAGAAGAFAVLCVNPRAFDDDLERGDGKNPQALATFRRYWQALDHVVLAWKIDSAHELTASLLGRAADAPQTGKQVLQELAVPSELWTRFPEAAILRSAGRVDIAALVQALGEFAPADERQAGIDGLQKVFGAALGLDVIKDVLPNMGPDVGICVTPSADRSKVPHVTLAVGMRPGAKQVDRTVLQALSSAAWLGMVNYNMQHNDKIVMKTRLQDGVEINSFVNEIGFPAGFEPALALKDGYLLIVSHPDAVRGFRQGNASLPADNPLLRLSLPRLADNLRERRAEIARILTEKRGLPEPAVAFAVDSLIASLELFDELSLSMRVEPGQAAWTVRMKAK